MMDPTYKAESHRPFSFGKMRAGRLQPTEELDALFSQREIRRLKEARSPNGSKTTVLCFYENVGGRSGGVFAVSEYLPSAVAHMLEERGEDLLVISPWHTRLKTSIAEESFTSRAIAHIETIKVPFGEQLITVDILERKAPNRFGEGQVTCLFLRAIGFFEADGGQDGTDPYIYSTDPCSNGDRCRLLRDSLLACAAIPYVLAKLGRLDVILHLHDWQFATAALTSKLAVLNGVLRSAFSIITSHNPYDHFLPEDQLAFVTDRVLPSFWPSIPDAGLRLEDTRQTVYSRMLPIADGPMSTVSDEFAKDLRIDPLQTGHFTNHLQGIYARYGIVGVNNGCFRDLVSAFSPEAIAAASSGNFSKILKEKALKRSEMLRILGDYRDPRMFGSLDGGPEIPLQNLPDNVPVFLCFGRLDPSQKGFDLLARAIEALPAGLRASFLRRYAAMALLFLVMARSSMTLRTLP